MVKNIIYSFNDFRELLKEKADVGTYLLLTEDNTFEKIEKCKRIERKVFIEARKIARQVSSKFNVAKYIEFNFKDDYATGQIYDFIQNLKKKNIKVFLTFFNQSEKNCTVLFISNGNDKLLEYTISDFFKIDNV